MGKPTFEIPLTRAAVARYVQLMNNQALREDVGDTWMVALSAVGRMEWNNSTNNVPNMHEGVHNWDVGVNCWSSVLKFAMLSGAMSRLQFKRFVDLTNGPSSFG